jgi:hypothetical protein
MLNLEYIDLGIKDYKETWDYQEDVLKKVTGNEDEPSKKDFGGI